MLNINQKNLYSMATWYDNIKNVQFLKKYIFDFFFELRFW